MKKYRMAGLILLFCLFTSICFAETNRVRVQVIFRKALWICPKCGQEDVEDFNVDGGNTYEHNCSKCGTWFNYWKNYDGCLTYSEDEYKLKVQDDITTEKTQKFNDWVYEIKNPPVYVEPSLEDLQKMLTDKQAELNQLQEQINAKEVIIIE